MIAIRLIAVFVVAYLLGSLSFAIIISKIFFKQDIRNFGSGNAGMTNVLRTFGKGAAVATFAGDFLKGSAAVLFAKFMFGASVLNYTGPAPSFSLGFATVTFDRLFWYEIAMYIAIAGALLGHLFPLYFKFKGGKGISVAFGAATTALPVLTLSAFGVFLLVFVITRMVSRASVLSVVAFFIFVVIQFFTTGVFSLPTFIVATVCPCVIIYAHRSNIKRILNGTEYRFTKKK